MSAPHLSSCRVYEVSFHDIWTGKQKKSTRVAARSAGAALLGGKRREPREALQVAQRVLYPGCELSIEWSVATVHDRGEYRVHILLPDNRDHLRLLHELDAHVTPVE